MPELTRRERYRRQTIDEITGLAMAQIAEGGVAALSLNAIARKMAMSPPAIYRYFASRDDLLAELVVEAYGALADALEAAAAKGNGADRVRSVANAYRDWAIAQPNRYQLIFESTMGSGLELAPERVIPAAQRSMDVFLAALADLAQPPTDPLPPALEAQLRAWAQRSGNDHRPARVQYLGISWWARLHGLISLELGHHLAATGVDPTLLYEAEIDSLLRLFPPTPECAP